MRNGNQSFEIDGIPAMLWGPASDKLLVAVHGNQSNQRFFMEDGKLHYEYDGNSFDVEPATMQRKASLDNIPPFVSVEK